MNLPHMTASLPLFSLLAERVRKKPDACAVVYRNQAISYLALATGALKLVQALQAQGIKPGTKVGLSFNASPMALMLLFALARLGACVIPLSLGRDEASRAEIAQKFGVNVLIAENAQARLAGVPSLEIHSVSISTLEMQQTQDLLQQTGASAYEALASMPWFVVLSSGSTGVPKGVALTQAQAWARIRQSLLPWTESTRVMPYDLAIGAGLFPALRTLAAGGTVIITEDSDFKAGLAEFATRHRATHVMSSPWMAAQLLQQVVDQKAAMPTVEFLWIAGGHCARHVLEGLMERATPNVWVKYASAETGVVAAAPARELLSTPGMSGRIGSWIEAGVVNDAGEPLPQGSSGLLRFKAPGWPQAYADAQDNAEGAFRDGWYVSKDHGRILPNGYLIVEGRVEGLVNVAGMRVQAEFFEELLSTRLALKECAVFSVLQADGSSKLAVALAQADAAKREAVTNLLMEHFKDLTRDVCLVFELPSLPRTPMGKISRRQLQQQFSVSV
jgi:acyl-coenzyme A synthetase/AMP-(fatty) acid ligase